MNKSDLLEHLTQCRVDVRAAIIELDKVRPEKRAKKSQPSDQAETMPINGKAKAVAG